MAEIRAYTAEAAKAPLSLKSYDPGPLGADEVELTVEHCGICHSDLSMLNNDWGFSRFPFVPGHEVIGRIAALGEHAKGSSGLQLGQYAGVGWNAGSCMHCRPCLSGDQHLCADVQATMIGHHGGFAERVRSHWAWAIPLPAAPGAAIDAREAGPLLCGGITVFAPLATFGVRPLDRVGVVGIGGLGHMAVKFAAAWGCDVTAFTSNESKYEEARAFGANHVVSSRDSNAIAKLAGSLDLLLVTVNVSLDWTALINALAPKGRMHVVGAVPEPIPLNVFQLISGQKQISSSPTGPPVLMAQMLEFAARHNIAPQTEHYKMSQVNEALARLKSGKARYRIVLDVDF